jgi:hypothetical protein
MTSTLWRCTSRAVSARDEPWRTEACSPAQVRNGKVVETWQHSEDQYAADEFLS